MSAIEVTTQNGYNGDSAPTPDPLLEDVDGGSAEDGDLFGDEDGPGEDEAQGPHRKLDDSELDSGDDEARNDRVAHTIEDEDEDVLYEQKQITHVDSDIARVNPPEGDDLYLVNLPPFLGLKHKNFDPATFELPKQPHDGRDPEIDPDVKFSPFSTAASTMYWRRDPKNPELLQSNSRIIRWSDGTLTLQIASKPQDHYRISTTALRQSFNRKKNQPQPDYDPNKDTHNYLAAPHIGTAFDLQTVAPFDAALRIQPTGDLADESVLKLQQSLAAAAQIHDPLATLKQVKEDPELAKKAAEMFEKDRMRTARKREAAEDRLILRKDRVLGRSGLGRMAGAGLSVAGLEDDEDGMPTARGTKAKSGAKARRRKMMNRRGDIYSDDEDEDLPRGRTREDEYDREDDFLAASDEEPETYEDEEEEEVLEDEDDDPDVDDLEIEGRQTVIPERDVPVAAARDRGGIRNRDRDREQERGDRDRGGGGGGGARQSTPKRAAESDAEGEVDDGLGLGPATAGSPQARKKRRVIDDDDDEE